MIPAVVGGIVALAGELAPIVAGWLGGPKAEAVTEKVVDVALKATGAASPEAALAMMQADPEKAMAFQKMMLEGQAEMARIANEVPLALIDAERNQVSRVNETMQVEAKSEKWWQSGWRPYIGFVFGTYILSLFTLPIFHIKPERLSVDEVMAVLAVLGVASWGRSMLAGSKGKKEG